MTPGTDRMQTNSLDPKIAKAADIKTQQTPVRPAAAQETVSAPKADVKLMTKEELNKKILGNDSVQVVNVLDPQYYNLGLIKGSKRIPLDKLDSRMNELDKSKEVVTYCASSECNASKKAAALLAGKGFRVSAYEGGIKEWKEAGLPTDTQ